MRRWLESDRIPAPYLTETVRGVKVYSHGELETISRVLHHHQQEYAYLSNQHESVIHTMFQYIQAYRAHNI
jgi:hypothetical protein